MSISTKKKHDPLAGAEASRKVGWAKYYRAREEADELRWLLKLVCERALVDPRMRRDDPLVVLAEEILRSLAVG